MTLKLLVIDDHPLMMKGIIAALQTLPERAIVLSAYDGEQALAALKQNPELDLVLLDLALPGPERTSGYALIARIHERMPALPVLVVSALEEPENVRLALSAGAMGFVPKSAAADLLISAVQNVLAGNISVPASFDLLHCEADRGGNQPDVRNLTRRQFQVLKGVCQGKTNRQVATELGVTEKTIKTHITGVFKALRVVTRTQAVLIARRLGMMPR